MTTTGEREWNELATAWQRSDDPGTERLPVLGREVLEAADQDHAEAHREREQRQQAGQRAQRQLGAVDQRGDEAADQRDRQGRSRSPRPWWPGRAPRGTRVGA